MSQPDKVKALLKNGLTLVLFNLDLLGAITLALLVLMSVFGLWVIRI